MMKLYEIPKICLIMPYFGNLPPNWGGFIESCKDNKNIDFLFITDCAIDSIPSNVHIINVSWEKFKKEIVEKLKKIGYKRICLTHPYKICDIRPCFGFLFEEYLRGYEFWGYMDCDLIWGNIGKFLYHSLINEWDRLYRHGHLSICKNKKDLNMLFMSSKDFKRVLATTFSCNFDESGFNRLLEASEFKFRSIKENADFAEYDYAYRCFNIGHTELGELFVKDSDGATKVYRKLASGQIECIEVNYIHFLSKKDIIIPNDIEPPYCISHKGVFSLKEISIDEAIEKYTLCSKAEQSRFLRKKISAMRKASFKKIIRELKCNHIYAIGSISGRIKGWFDSLKFINKK